MANNRLSMRKITGVLRLHYECGRTQREISRASGASPATVGEYLGKYLANCDLLQLPIRVLVEATNADIADALTLQDASKGKSVRMKSITFDEMCR